jgi:hypothetical protein
LLDEIDSFTVRPVGGMGMRIALALLFGVGICGCNDAGRGRRTDAGPGIGGGGEDGGTFAGCAMADYEGKQAPAAMLVVLDRSSSMAQNNKWTFAAQAVVQALDGDVFDSMHVGLYAAPTGTMAGPSCIFGLPVACQAPPFPQIDLALAGLEKSNGAAGVRKQIKSWLSANSPDSGIGDASPLYAAIEAGIGSLRAWNGGGKRILFVVTDGTLSCCEFSSRPGFADANGCSHDWEHPGNLVTLIGNANQDPQKPIETFVVGVPGADTYDASGASYPPYHMRLALSAIGYAGSPAHAPAGCTGTTFTQAGADPATSCHFDMTQGGYNAQAVADAIALVRGKVLGCVFDLPQPPGGGAVDPTQVNVEMSVAGQSTPLYRRKDPSNLCASDGCWDYTADGRVELIGLACTDLKTDPKGKIKIVVGCQTVIQ